MSLYTMFAMDSLVLVKLACGGASSENNTYIVQSGVTTLTSPCTYDICPCSTDICRIRYDFTVTD